MYSGQTSFNLLSLGQSNPVLPPQIGSVMCLSPLCILKYILYLYVLCVYIYRNRCCFALSSAPCVRLGFQGLHSGILLVTQQYTLAPLSSPQLPPICMSITSFYHCAFWHLWILRAAARVGEAFQRERQNNPSGTAASLNVPFPQTSSWLHFVIRRN